jgi:hypothetical protein
VLDEQPYDAQVVILGGSDEERVAWGRAIKSIKKMFS